MGFPSTARLLASAKVVALLLFAQAIQIPAPTGLVNDFAHVITPDAAQRMKAIAADVRAKSRGEITIVTLPDIGTRDVVCPPRTIAPVFERIRAFKSLLVYPELDHNTCTDFNVHAIAWLTRYLAV